MKTLGWCHEGESCGKWDRYCLGYDEAWENETRDPNYVELGGTMSAKRKGKSPANGGRHRSGTETEETYLSSRAGSVATSPVIPQGGTSHGWYQSSTPERVASPVMAAAASSSSTVSSPVIATAVSPTLARSLSDAAETRLYVDEEQVVAVNGFGRKTTNEEDEDEVAERERRFEADEEERELMA